MRRLLSSSGSMLLSTASRAVAQWLLLLFFALLGGPDEVGEYARALAVTTPIFIMSEGGLRSIIVTSDNPPAYSRSIAIRLRTASLAGLLSLLIGTYLNLEFAAILLPLTLLKFADSMIDVPLAFLQAGRSFRACATGGITNSSLTVLFAASAVALDSSTQWILWASFCGSTATALVYLRKAGENGTRTQHRSRLLPRMIPLGISTGVNSLLVYSPVFYLGLFAAPSTVGVYAAIAQALTAANIVLSAAQQGALPWLRAAKSEMGTQFGQEWIRVASLFISLGVGLAVGLVVLLPPLTPLIYGPGFRVSVYEALPLGAATLALASIYLTSGGLLVANRYTVQLYAAIAGLLAIFVVGLLLAPSSTLLHGTALAFTGYFARAVVGTVMWFRVSRMDELMRRL